MTQLLIRLFVRHPDDTKNAAVRKIIRSIDLSKPSDK